MRLGELLELLEAFRDELGDDAEVRLMTQQNYPFENSVAGVCSGAEINAAGDEEEGDDEGGDCENDRVVYICEGSQLGYGTKRAWEVARR